MQTWVWRSAALPIPSAVANMLRGCALENAFRRIQVPNQPHIITGEGEPLHDWSTWSCFLGLMVWEYCGEW